MMYFTVFNACYLVDVNVMFGLFIIFSVGVGKPIKCRCN